MQRAIRSLPPLSCVAALAILLSSGCQSDVKLLQKQIQIRWTWMSRIGGDDPVWAAERERISTSLGNRVFEQDAGVVYDAILSALPELGSNVEGLDRASGFITARGFSMPPDEATPVREATMREWAARQGFDVSVLDQPPPKRITHPLTYSSLQDMEAANDFTFRTTKTCTFSVASLGPGRSRVVAAYTGVFYPRELERLYQMLWTAIDAAVWQTAGRAP